MRSIAAGLLLLAALATAETILRPAVEVDVTGFKAAVSDGRVVATWKRYKRDDFQAYKIVKSLKGDPMYPDDQPIFSSDSSTDLRYEDGKLSLGAWRYRLCIVTRFGDRWVSPAVVVNIDQAALKRAAPTAADFEGP